MSPMKKRKSGISMNDFSLSTSVLSEMTNLVPLMMLIVSTKLKKTSNDKIARNGREKVKQ